MNTYIKKLNTERNVTLTCYIQGTGNGFGHLDKRPAVLIIPGGAYTHWSERESDPIAFAFLKAGFQAFILRYTLLDKGTWPMPLEDYQEAMKYIIDHKSSWAIEGNQIAVLGFSAGGHLAACGALMTEYKPQILLLGYSLLTDEIQKYMNGFPSPIDYVTKTAPSSFLFATANDKSVSVINTLQFASKLAENHVMFECHVYPYGKHGFSTGESCTQQDDEKIYPFTCNWMHDGIEFCRNVFATK